MSATTQKLQQLQEKIERLVREAECQLERAPTSAQQHLKEAQILAEKFFLEDEVIYQRFMDKKETIDRKINLHFTQTKIRDLFQQGKKLLKNDAEQAEQALQEAMDLAEKCFPEAEKLKQRIYKLLKESQLRKLIVKADQCLHASPDEAFRLYSDALKLAKLTFPEAENTVGWLRKKRKKAEEISTSIYALSSSSDDSLSQKQTLTREKTPMELAAVPSLLSGALSPSSSGEKISSIEASVLSAPRASLQEIRKRALEAIQAQEAKIAETQSRANAALKNTSSFSSEVSKMSSSQVLSSKMITSNSQHVLKGEVIDFTDGFAVIRLGDEPEQQVYLSPREISWTINYGDAKHYFEKGVERVVEFVVLGTDEKERLLVSLRQCRKDPWEEEISSRFPIGTEIDGEAIYCSSTYKNILIGSTLAGEEIRARLLEPEEHSLKLNKSYRFCVKKLEPEKRRMYVSYHSGLGTELSSSSASFLGHSDLASPFLHRSPYPSDSFTSVKINDLVVSHQRLLLVGPLNARELRCAIQAFEPTSIAYDPFALDIRVLRDQRANIQPESLFVSEAATPSELEQSFSSFIEREPEEQSTGIVLSPQARFEESLAATSLAQRQQLPLYYFAAGDSERLFSFPKHIQVFSLPSLHLKVTELLGQTSAIVSHKCEALPPEQALIDSCVLLAAHSTCCAGTLSDFMRRFKERQEKIWIPPSQKHGKHLLAELSELGVLLQGKPFKHENSWGARLNHNDHSRRLFESGIWLEYAMAAVALRIPHVQDVQLRVRLQLERSISRSLQMRSDARELDCVISIGSQMYCIECKSGEWDAQDVHYFGRLANAIGAKGIFISVGEEQVQRCLKAANDEDVVLVTASDFTREPELYILPCSNH